MERILENRKGKFFGAASAIRAVIFDFGEVLCVRAPLESFAPMGKILKLTPEQMVEHYMENRLPYDRGDVTTPEYWNGFARETGATLSDADVKELDRLDRNLWRRMDPGMLDWVERLRTAGIKVGVLSNMFLGFATELRREASWLKQFDALTFSAEIRHTKPDAAIYEHSLRQLGVRAGEALFLDDREVNVEGARALGIESLLFKTPSQLREDLKAWGFSVLPG